MTQSGHLVTFTLMLQLPCLWRLLTLLLYLAGHLPQLLLLADCPPFLVGFPRDRRLFFFSPLPIFVNPP